MSPESLELAGVWLKKARSDLDAALVLMSDQKPLVEIALFHCQQGAEKALKSWLTASEIIFPKTHSLVDILRLCSDVQPAFAKFREHAIKLTPFATEFRYPADIPEPKREIAAGAFQLAEEIYAFCEKQIAELRPDNQ